MGVWVNFDLVQNWIEAPVDFKPNNRNLRLPGDYGSIVLPA